MRLAKLFLCALLMGGLLSSGGCGSRSVPANQPVSTPFDAMVAHLDSMAAGFEDQKDVKCWTSFKRLETFIAGCQLTPATTHLKSEVVIDLVDQVWKAAADSADDVTSGGCAAAAGFFPKSLTAFTLDWAARAKWKR